MDIAVIAGSKYTDIDAFASAVAYARLLELSGFIAESFLAPLNQSVPKIVRKLGAKYSSLNAFNSYPERGFVVVDVSNPEFFPDFVHEPDVLEVWDHHFGHEEYWRDLIGDKAFIEPVGACATLIYEEWAKNNRLTSLDPINASLLQTAILSNTLNFSSIVTTQRDMDAYENLALISNLGPNWSSIYFGAIQNDVLRTPLKELIKGDSKVINIKKIGNVFIFQLELYSGEQFLLNNKDKLIGEVKRQAGDLPYLITIPSIKDKKNFLLTPNKALQTLLTARFGAKFIDDKGVSERLFLRKELLV